MSLSDSPRHSCTHAPVSCKLVGNVMQCNVRLSLSSISPPSIKSFLSLLYNIKILSVISNLTCLNPSLPSLSDLLLSRRMAVTPCQEQVQGQADYNISIVSDKELANIQHLACLNFQEAPQCMEPKWDFNNCTILQIGSLDRYSPCDVDMDAKKESQETHRADDRPIGSLIRTDSSLSRMPRRKISLQIGEKIMQLFMNHSSMLQKSNSGDKLATERAPDTPNSRWRRYKRAASFNSRKVVLLFSILSSFGTLVLIYLTLRVKQMDDGFTPHV